MSNVVTARFLGGNTIVTTNPISQWNKGQILKFEGIDLPPTYRVDFANEREKQETVFFTGTAEGGVDIPDILLETGKYIYAFVVIVDENSVTTEYVVRMPVDRRGKPSNVEPSQEQQTEIEQLIVIMNDTVENAEDSALKAEGYAVGTQDDVPVEEGSPYYENNAYYYSEQSKQSAQQAESAKEDAELAQSAAEDAQELAEIAQGKAEDAQRGAEDAEDGAERYEAQALQYSQDAYQSAERAEQAAQTAGYLDVKIDENGHLIYIKTDAVDVDFDLNDQGHLIMEAV